jgi:signal transduction histidine kinase
VSKARVPHVALVLLPALALAAVGVRAVTAEMRASEDAARERARSVASRLARSVDALVEEYAGPLAALPDGYVDDHSLNAALAHLEPHGAFGIPAIERRGSTVSTATPTRLESSDDEAGSERELVEDALATARRLAGEPQGAAGAATLLDATARIVKSPHLHWLLRYTEARYDLSVGDRDRAMSALASAWERHEPAFRVVGGFPCPEAAVGLAAEIVAGSPPPEWLVAAYEHCTRKPFFPGEPVIDPLLATLGAPSAERLRPAIRLRKTASRVTESSRGEPISAALLTLDGATLRLSVWRTAVVGAGWSLVGGEVPVSVVDGRVGAEARALGADPGVTAVRLVAATGDGVFEVRGAATDPRNAVAESTPLAGPLSSWRAEAVVAPESGIPATAWLLGAALAVTTAALVAGMLALRRSADRSARLAEDRQTFLDHVAHELRTPAAAVQALTEELASGHVAKDREAAYREHLLRESRRLSALVEDTLDLTRLDAGRLAFKMEPADLRDVVRRAVEESDGAGRVTATLPEAPVVRAVDEATLRRAVRNLVENAIRHGGGDAPVRVTLEAENGAASIAVADEGRGIAKEHLPRLFERFYRVPSPTHETKGVGLGLALCREVARAHGGDVTVASQVGKGSTFTLRIPLA